MSRLEDLIGRESDLGQVCGTLRQFALSLRVPVVGACQVSCSDEAEWECVEAFQRLFARTALPPLKSNHRAAFRTVNMGARYESGAAHLAEEHFALAGQESDSKLIVVKINAHVAVRQGSEGPEYGWLLRYGADSTCCGALAAALAGGDGPAVRELAEAFAVGQHDRLAVLRDPDVVPPALRALLAAVTSARLQAERAADDIGSRPPLSPTVFLVLPCVTINRRDLDTELVVGQYGIDWSGAEPQLKYHGLGHDPARYRPRYEMGRLLIEDDGWSVT
jgi:hypothetical protein